MNPKTEILLSQDMQPFQRNLGHWLFLWSVLIDLDVEETVGLSSRCVAHMSADVSHVILMPSAAL